MQLVHTDISFVIDQTGNLHLKQPSNRNSIVFEISPSEKRRLAEILLCSAVEQETAAEPVVQAAIANARGQVQ